MDIHKQSTERFLLTLAKMIRDDLILPQEPKVVTILREVPHGTLDFHPETGLLTRAEGASLFVCSDRKTRRIPWRYDIQNHKLIEMDKQILEIHEEVPLTLPVSDFMQNGFRISDLDL